MLFSSPIFIFGFLPIALILYYFSPKFLRNFMLLSLSLFFYAWGEVFFIMVIIISIFVDYIFGISIDKSIGKRRSQQLAIGIAFHILMLIYFKYTDFIVINFNNIFSILGLQKVNINSVHLPMGISFFTFKSISYLFDVYRRVAPAQRNFISIALYISIFPQLLAGPIVRYRDSIYQISSMPHSLENFSVGAQRFIYGLSKKILIANPLGEVADLVFSFKNEDLTLPLAWIGILAYTLQIFFDFSGYSDMAIGLGRLFGFQFTENFNYPYISVSLREFWRRWHITLSNFFRDYVYIPLGGSRLLPFRIYFNLLIVFALCGFWHGASWNFLIWGLFHGLFIVFEHTKFFSLIKERPKPIQHIYLIVVVVIGWVFFRSATFSQSVSYICAMFNIFNFSTTPLQFAQVLSYEVIYVFILGLILSTPISLLSTSILNTYSSKPIFLKMIVIRLSKCVALFTLFLLSAIKMSASTYNPFIYFRF